MSSHGNTQDDAYTQFRAALDELERVQVPAEVAAAAEGNPVQQFCKIWPTVRKVVETILKIPFIPSAAKTVLKALLTAGNLLCGG